MSRKRVTRGGHKPVPLSSSGGQIDGVDLQLSVEPGEVAFTWFWLPDAVLPSYIQLWTSTNGAGYVKRYSQLVAVDGNVGVAGGFAAGQTVAWYVLSLSPTGELLQRWPTLEVVL